LSGSATGGNKGTQGSVSAKLGYGGTYEQTAAEVAVQNALDSLTSGTANLQKPKERTGLIGNFSASLSAFSPSSLVPTPKPKSPSSEKPTSSGSQQSSSVSSSGQQPSTLIATPTSAETEAYRAAVMKTSMYGPGYYEGRGASASESELAMSLRDADTTIRDYRAKYLEGGSKGLETPKMMSDGVFGFNKGGLARFMKAGKVTTTTGYDIKGGIMGADTQYTPPMALKPGEDMYIIPSEAAPEMDKMVAKFDRNSNAAKNQSNLKPSGPKISFQSLPPLGQPSGRGGNSGQPEEGPSPSIPKFSVLMNSPVRIEVANSLGIGDLV